MVLYVIFLFTTCATWLPVIHTCYLTPISHLLLLLSVFPHSRLHLYVAYVCVRLCNVSGQMCLDKSCHSWGRTGPTRALPSSTTQSLSKCTATLINHRGRMNGRSVVRTVWFDSQPSPRGVDISSRCLRGVLWGGWLRSFNQDRIIVESKNSQTPCQCLATPLNVVPLVSLKL